MKDQLNSILEKALNDIKNADSAEILDSIRVNVLGKKGQLTAILRGMGSLSADMRPVIGSLANEVRTSIETALEKAMDEMHSKAFEQKLKNEKIDVTIGGNAPVIGKKHPVSIVLDEICDIFTGMGFTIADGPEVELDYYNFEALNIPKGHPARDEQDTFYINDSIVLRTQTSPMQIRSMEGHKPPIRILAPGRVFRSDAVDATHSPVFHQIEGLVVAKGITMADLKGTLELFAKRLYGDDTKVRFRPHHFPFTEPSAEMDVQCFKCKGEGCRLCKGEGYIEVLGCGMVHPKVLSVCGIDPNEYTGFAFGMGLERLVMRKYKIDDLRLLSENDVRFLNQF